jgi:ring-1,2-phenylacetyl-CoA epoxidase subunit PaaD
MLSGKNMTIHAQSKEEIYRILDVVCDPEIPVLTINDMGLVRDVRFAENGEIEVDITPTYSGCPAMKTIEKEIIETLNGAGFEHISVKEVLSPAWTTDWLSQAGREKLEAYGIAPPVGKSVDKSLLMGDPKSVRCPNCKSMNTEMVSQFGSTACKALYKCTDCLEPFDYFKCI